MHEIATHETDDDRYNTTCACGWASSGTFAGERTASAIGTYHLHGVTKDDPR